MEIKDFLLAEMNREVERSRRALEQVPSGQYDWKPHEKSMIFGYITRRQYLEHHDPDRWVAEGSRKNPSQVV